MTLKNELEIAYLVKSGSYPDADSVLRSALNALFLSHPEQKLQMIATAYRAGDISLGRSAELMGVSTEEMKELLHQQGVKIHLGPQTENELKQELAAFESS